MVVGDVTPESPMSITVSNALDLPEVSSLGLLTLIESFLKAISSLIVLGCYAK